jgi:hypothetical protein
VGEFTCTLCLLCHICVQHLINCKMFSTFPMDFLFLSNQLRFFFPVGSFLYRITDGTFWFIYSSICLPKHCVDTWHIYIYTSITRYTWGGVLQARQKPPTAEVRLSEYIQQILYLLLIFQRNIKTKLSPTLSNITK